MRIEHFGVGCRGKTVGGTVCDPTHRDKAAMDGAPERIRMGKVEMNAEEVKKLLGLVPHPREGG